jgi:threonine/homoserine/homoserine lactone efflux protein
MENLAIMPLAITMMAGPQIMSAIIFVTSPRAGRISLAFLIGVFSATVIGTLLAFGLANLLGGQVSLGDSSDSGSTGNVIQYVLVGLLVLAAIKNFVGRETVEPPKWLGKLQEAGPREALRTGLLVILLMPSDIIIMLTVGMNLEHTNSSFWASLPFIAATLFVASLPLLVYFLFGTRAREAMPKVRNWMNDNSWAVNIIVCVIFILLILA